MTAPGPTTSVGVLVAGLTWRYLRLPRSGRTLLAAATGPDPNRRELAGMLLTQAGDRSVPLLSAALARGQAPEQVAQLLASNGSQAARDVLTRSAASPDPDTASAARSALDTLDRIRRAGDGPAGPAGPVG